MHAKPPKYPAESDLENSLIRLSWLQHRRFASQIADLQLTVPQFYTLSTLQNMGGQASMGDLARRTQQVSATMTGIIDRLVRDGLVSRVRDEADRRSVIVHITPAGEALVWQAWERAVSDLNPTVSSLSPSEQAAAHKLVDSLLSVMELEEEQ